MSSSSTQVAPVSSRHEVPDSLEDVGIVVHTNGVPKVKKIDRLRYALRRYRQTHSEADYEAHKTKTLNNLENGINFYQAFNLDQFKNRNQYRHIKHLINNLKEKD